MYIGIHVKYPFLF